jgi:hypothetical protein
MSNNEIILVKTIRADLEVLVLCRPPYYVAQFTIKLDSKFHGQRIRDQETNKKVTFIHTYKD